MTYKTQEIIAKCLKQFDLRLFEEIGEKVQEKEKNTKGIKKIKKHFKSFCFAKNWGTIGKIYFLVPFLTT